MGDLKDVIFREGGLLAESLWWTLIGLILMWGAYSFFERISPFDDWEELRKGNVAVAIFFAGVFVGIAIIISTVIGTP